MFDIQYNAKKWPAKAPLKFLGTVPYELNTAPEISETFDYQGHGARVVSMQFSPDGNTLATGSDDGYLLAWDATTGKALMHPQLLFEFCIYDFYFAYDAQRVVATSIGETRVCTGFPGSCELGPIAKVMLSGINAAGKLGVALGGEGVVVYDLVKNKPLRGFKINAEFVTAIAGDRWAAGSDGEIIIGAFDAKGVQRRTTKLQVDGADGIAANPDGMTLVIWHDGSLEIHDLTKATALRATDEAREIRLVTLGPTSTMLVAPYHAPMEVWQYRTGKRKLVLDAGKDCYSNIALSNDEEIALGVQNNGDSLDVWQLPSGKRLARLTKKDLQCKRPDGISTAALAPSGQHLAVGMFGGGMRFFQIGKERLSPLYQPE